MIGPEVKLMPILEDVAWQDRVTAVVDEAHAENLGGKHRTGFCEACADAYLVAQRAVPRTEVSSEPLFGRQIRFALRTLRGRRS